MDKIELKFANKRVMTLDPSDVLAIAIFDNFVVITNKDGTSETFWRKIHGYYYAWQTT